MQKVVGSVFDADGTRLCDRVVIVFDVGARRWSGNFDLPSPADLAGQRLSIQFLDGGEARVEVTSVGNGVAHFVGLGPPPARRN